jgi:hypothetical protein
VKVVEAVTVLLPGGVSLPVAITFTPVVCLSKVLPRFVSSSVILATTGSQENRRAVGDNDGFTCAACRRIPPDPCLACCERFEREWEAGLPQLVGI